MSVDPQDGTTALPLPEKRCPMCQHLMERSEDGKWWECLCGFRETTMTMADYKRRMGEP